MVSDAAVALNTMLTSCADASTRGLCGFQLIADGCPVACGGGSGIDGVWGDALRLRAQVRMHVLQSDEVR